MIETTTQSFTVRLGEVRCYDTDTGKPLRGACVEPFTQVSTGIAPDKVDHDPTVQIDDTSCVTGRVGAVCFQIGSLIHTQLVNMSHPVWGVNQGLAVLNNRGR